MADITLMRVYDLTPPAAQESFLVDRLWPRGISKERLTGVQWLKEVAPSNALRQWFHQHLDYWTEFEQRYIHELQASQAWLPLLAKLTSGQNIQLLYGSKNTGQNHAIVLRDFLLAQLNRH